jgi:hypothetical protein
LKQKIGIFIKEAVRTLQVKSCRTSEEAVVLVFGLFEETIEKRRVCIQQMENCKFTSFRIVPCKGYRRKIEWYTHRHVCAEEEGGYQGLLQ